MTSVTARDLLRAEEGLHDVDPAHPRGPGRNRHGRASNCSPRHQATRSRRPVSQVDLGPEAEIAAAASVEANRRVTALTARSGPYSMGRSEPIAASSARARSARLVSVPLPTLYTPSRTRGRGQQVCPGNVDRIDEIHGLGAVAKDQRRLAIGNPLHPPDQYLRVEAVDVHAWPVDIERPKRDVVEAIHGPEAAQHSLVERLCRPIKGVVVVVMVFRRRKLLRQPVDGGGRGGHDLVDRCWAAASSTVKVPSTST